MAPNCAITFLSKCYGGRASVSHITNNTGFLNLLSPGDVVLGDKGFLTIKAQDVITVLPPRAKKNTQFTVEEMEKTRQIGSVRVHVERLIGKLKNFRILRNRIETNLLPHINKIVHVCAVLVNLSPSILKSNEEEEERIEGDHILSGSETESTDEEEEDKEEVVEIDGTFEIDANFLFNSL